MNGRTCEWLEYEFTRTPCRLIHHITHCIIYTCIFTDGSVHRALCHASYIRCNMCILMTLYLHYPVYEVMMSARCTMVLWHIWQRYIWYICYMFFTYCMSCPSPSPIATPTRLLQLVLSLCIFKVELIQPYQALNYCSPAHNCSRCVVDRRWLCRRRRDLTACGDCYLQLPLPGDMG